jgi:Rieske Fe-S protein
VDQNRRIFLKKLAWAFLFLLTFGAVKSIFKASKNSRKKELIINLPLNEGVNLVENIIVVKTGEQYFAFSRSCTHLGCSLKREGANSLICPCHSSRFSSNGDVLRGPASRPLDSYSVKHDSAVGRLIVEIIN